MSSSNNTSSSNVGSHSLNPWDFWIARDDSLPSKVVDYMIYCIAFPAVLLYIPTCYTICKLPSLWKRSAYRLLVAQDIFESLNLIVRVLAILVDFSANKELAELPFVCYLINDIIEILWYISLYSHLMIAGNRFVAVVFYSIYNNLFTTKFTAIYISVFLLLPIIQRESLTVAGIRGCVLERAGVVLTSPNPQVLEAYIMVDMLVTAIIVGLLIVGYVIITYKLRQVIQKRRANAKANVPTEASTVIQVKPKKAAVAPLDGESVLEPPSSTGNNTDGNTKRITTTTKSNKEKTKSKTMDSKEIKLTIHFILVTTVYVTTYLFWLISYFSTVPYAYDIFSLLTIINFSSNAIIILFISQEIRTSVFNSFACAR